MQVRDAINVPHKETGPLDANCFQIIFDGEVLTLRVGTVPDKLQWLNQIDTAIKAVKSFSKVPSILDLSNHSGGTLRLKLLNINFQSSSKNRSFPYSSVFLIAKIENQALKSKKIGARDTSLYQSLIFSIPSAESKLRISIYAFHKYSADGIMN